MQPTRYSLLPVFDSRQLIVVAYSRVCDPVYKVPEGTQDRQVVRSAAFDPTGRVPQRSCDLFSKP